MVKAGILKLAIEEAEKSNCRRYYIGAVVSKSGAILGSGHNAKRAHSIHKKYQIWAGSLHAEQAAVLGLDWSKLKGASILVVRITKGGNFSLARPCPTCFGLLNHIGIKKLFYTDRNGQIQFERL